MDDAKPNIDQAQKKQPGDPLLVLLIRAAEGSEMSMNAPVMVCVSGTIIQGQVISYKQWVDASAEAMKNAQLLDSKNQPATESFRTTWSEWLETARVTMSKSIPAEQVVNNLHLRHVRIMNGGGTISCPVFRVRLTDISGFALGGTD